MSHVTRSRSVLFSTMSHTNQAVQPQKMARSLKFGIYEVEGLYFLCSENKGAAQLICIFVFAYAKNRFSHDAAHIVKVVSFEHPLNC